MIRRPVEGGGHAAAIFGDGVGIVLRPEADVEAVVGRRGRDPAVPGKKAVLDSREDRAADAGCAAAGAGMTNS